MKQVMQLIWSASAFVPAPQQGWVFSGKNLFFPGRVEKTGENLFFPGFFQFLPEKTGKKWKKPRNYYVYYILI